MANNFLEQLIAEWYELQGYFIRKNVLVGKRDRGGYECELDVVAFHPSKRHLVHIEASMDASSWAERERRFDKKSMPEENIFPFFSMSLTFRLILIKLQFLCLQASRNEILWLVGNLSSGMSY
jgi:hypothetical protein